MSPRSSTGFWSASRPNTRSSLLRGLTRSSAALVALSAALAACASEHESEEGEAGSLQAAVVNANAAQAGCGYELDTGTYTKWNSGYQAWVTLKNVNGPTGTAFEVFLDVGNTSIADGYQAEFDATEDGYRVTEPSWLIWQRIPQGASYQFGFIGSGVYAGVTPYLISVNGTRCDQVAPVVDLEVSQGLFTADGVLTLTATASDNVAVRKVVFEQDGAVIGEDTEAPFELEVAVTDALNGRHRYTATAVDPSGNAGSDEESVLVAIGNRFVGTAVDAPADYEHAALYFNQITPGNAGKWGSVEAARDTMSWDGLDAAVAFAAEHGFPFKLHTLVWGQQEPAWVAALPPEEQLAELEEWMAALAERYGDFAMIDVVNEPLHAPPSFKEALGGDGETGWDWVITAFEMARRHFPRSELHLNDYQVLIFDQFTTDYLEIVTLLQERGLIDGIGEQGHFLERAELDVVEANLARLAATGLPVHISELDVDFANDARHANRFRDLFTVFWENPSVVGVTHWGHLEGHMWRPNAFLINADGTPRPALDWLTCYLGGGDECPVPEYVPGPFEGDDSGLVLEAEDYDDAEGLLALGNAVAYTDDGDWFGYGEVVFQDGWDTFSVTYAKGGGDLGSLSLHLDSLESDPVLTLELPETGSWGTNATLELPWAPIAGSHAVFVRFSGGSGLANVDRLAFRSSEQPGPNLIPNGDFESGTAGWFSWGGTIGTSTELVHGGNQSLVLTDRAGNGPAAYDLTGVVTPGTIYDARFFVTITGAPTAPVNLTMKAVCGGTEEYPWFANHPAVPEGVWVELRGPLSVPDCDLTELLVYAEGPPEGVDLYVDDVFVREPAVSNLVTNGDFESSAAGWFTWDGTLAVTSERAHGGNQSLALTNRSGNGPAAYNLTSAVTPGASYTATFFVTVGGAETAPVNITTKIVCDGEPDAYPWVANHPAVPDGEWVELSNSFTVPDCDLTELLVYAEGPPGGVDLYVDDVSIR